MPSEAPTTSVPPDAPAPPAVPARPRGRRALWLSGAAAFAVVIGVALNWASISLRLRLAWYFEPLGPSAQGYSEYRHRKTGIVFVYLPGGTFVMGSPEDEGGREPDETQHEVTVGPFLIGKFEVTQTEWTRVMETNPSKYRGDDLPAESVSWEECQVFCARTGLALPTEAQWEFAARAGTDGPMFEWLDQIAWHSGNSGDRTHPVGQLEHNAFGLHDTLGNVREWCAEKFGGDSWRVVGGGSWRPRPRLVRARFRYVLPLDDRDDHRGFRVARVP